MGAVKRTEAPHKAAPETKAIPTVRHTYEGREMQ